MDEIDTKVQNWCGKLLQANTSLLDAWQAISGLYEQYTMEGIAAKLPDTIKYGDYTFTKDQIIAMIVSYKTAGQSFDWWMGQGNGTNLYNGKL